MMTDAGMFALTLAVWPFALWLIAWLVAGESPAKTLKVRKRVLFNLFAQVIAGDCFALLLAVFPKNLVDHGFARTATLVAIMGAAAVWNGDCFYRLVAPSLAPGSRVRLRLAAYFGFFSSPSWLSLMYFTLDWLVKAGPGITRAEFEFFAIQLVITPLVVLLLCPREKRAGLLDGLAVLRLLLLVALAPVAVIEGHIIGLFLDLKMGSPLFTAIWCLAAGVMMEECFRGVYAHFLETDPSAKARVSLLFGTLANPFWPVLIFGLQGMQF